MASSSSTIAVVPDASWPPIITRNVLTLMPEVSARKRASVLGLVGAKAAAIEFMADQVAGLQNVVVDQNECPHATSRKGGRNFRPRRTTAHEAHLLRPKSVEAGLQTPSNVFREVYGLIGDNVQFAGLGVRTESASRMRVRNNYKTTGSAFEELGRHRAGNSDNLLQCRLVRLVGQSRERIHPHEQTLFTEVVWNREGRFSPIGCRIWPQVANVCRPDPFRRARLFNEALVEARAWQSANEIEQVACKREPKSLAPQVLAK